MCSMILHVNRRYKTLVGSISRLGGAADSLVTMSTSTSLASIRREPPPFRHLEVRRAERLTPRMASVTFAGPDLEGLVVDEPAASVRLLLPSPGVDALVVPEWQGNEFLLPGGERPIIRTFTPPLRQADATELVLMIVLHEGGAASEWARAAQPGDAAALSGPGRGHKISGAGGYLLAGDETALPAIAQLLERLPAAAAVDVHVEIATPDAELPLPGHAGPGVTWHVLPAGAPAGSTLVAAVEEASLDPAGQVWAAGEAAGMQRIRKLLARRGFPRRQATVRGYWKRRG